MPLQFWPCRRNMYTVIFSQVHGAGIHVLKVSLLRTLSEYLIYLNIIHFIKIYILTGIQPRHICYD